MLATALFFSGCAGVAHADFLDSGISGRVSNSGGGGSSVGASSSIAPTDLQATNMGSRAQGDIVTVDTTTNKFTFATQIADPAILSSSQTYTGSNDFAQQVTISSNVKFNTPITPISFIQLGAAEGIIASTFNYGATNVATMSVYIDSATAFTYVFCSSFSAATGVSVPSFIFNDDLRANVYGLDRNIDGVETSGVVASSMSPISPTGATGVMVGQVTFKFWTDYNVDQSASKGGRGYVAYARTNTTPAEVVDFEWDYSSLRSVPIWKITACASNCGGNGTVVFSPNSYGMVRGTKFSVQP